MSSRRSQPVTVSRDKQDHNVAKENDSWNETFTASTTMTQESPRRKDNQHLPRNARWGTGPGPVFILDVMKKKFGDVVVYHDSGRPCYDWKFTHPIEKFVKLMKLSIRA